jgi:RNA recognition motif-containing protein
MIKIFAVGFPREMDEPAIYQLFSDFGDVKTVKLITDQQTGQSKGYAFIDFLDEAGAKLAIRDLDNTQLGDRTISVRFVDREARPRTITERPVQQRTYEKVRFNGKPKRPRRQP